MSYQVSNGAHLNNIYLEFGDPKARENRIHQKGNRLISITINDIDVREKLKLAHRENSASQ